MSEVSLSSCQPDRSLSNDHFSYCKWYLCTRSENKLQRNALNKQASFLPKKAFVHALLCYALWEHEPKQPFPFFTMAITMMMSNSPGHSHSTKWNSKSLVSYYQSPLYFLFLQQAKWSFFRPQWCCIMITIAIITVMSDVYLNNYTMQRLTAEHKFKSYASSLVSVHINLTTLFNIFHIQGIKNELAISKCNFAFFLVIFWTLVLGFHFHLVSSLVMNELYTHFCLLLLLLLQLLWRYPPFYTYFSIVFICNFTMISTVLSTWFEFV